MSCVGVRLYLFIVTHKGLYPEDCCVGKQWITALSEVKQIETCGISGKTSTKSKVLGPA